MGTNGSSTHGPILVEPEPIHPIRDALSRRSRASGIQPERGGLLPDIFKGAMQALVRDHSGDVPFVGASREREEYGPVIFRINRRRCVS